VQKFSYNTSVTGLAAAAVYVCAGNREAGITYLTLIPIAGGVVIASGGEPLFHLLGFVACLLATSGRALKSVVQVRPVQKQLSKQVALQVQGRDRALQQLISCYKQPG
jgi:drug/metabolite transporter (DMT)-like permease